MKEKIYLKPLKIHLSEVISPKQLAKLLEELTFDYSRMIIRLEKVENENDFYIHPDAESFLFNLKELRHVLRKCKV
ncbi:MAG: hypothetical protein LBV72_02405 [Tannerella sp.]|jgi:chromosome segregation and condensation protein ScpB|nr:hypothetical protein [Tannerella sp.]